MTITINGKKHPFDKLIKSEKEFIALIKEIYNKINFENEAINSLILKAYNKLKNDEGGVRYLRFNRWFPKEFGFKHSNKFTLGYWIERGFTEKEFQESLKEKSRITSEKFNRSRFIQKSEWDPNYSNKFKFNTSVFESTTHPTCNLCENLLDVYKSIQKGDPVYKIKGCSNNNCETKTGSNNEIFWKGFRTLY